MWAAFGGTYGGNPWPALLRSARSRPCRERDPPPAQAVIGDRMVERPRKLATGTIPAIAEVRGRGAMIAIGFGAGPQSNAGAPQGRRRRLRSAGVVVLTAGTYGNVIPAPSSRW